MKKRSHHKQIDRNNRSSTTRERQIIPGSVVLSHIPESIAEANHRFQALVEKDTDRSLEELQGAVEYLLDRVKAARGLYG